MPNPARPKISVIVPVYNSQEYLQQSLDSVYSQTLTDYELIVVDDGSTDRTAQILQANASEHPEVQVITQQNHGQGYARNRALEQATGKYVIFLDSDDFLDTTALEWSVRRAEADRADVVNYNWRMLVTDGRGQERTDQFNIEHFHGKAVVAGDDCEHFLEKHNYFCWDSLYCRAFLDSNAIRFGEGYIYEDNEFAVKVASYAQKISIIGEPLYTLRQNAGSSTRTQHHTDRHYRDFVRAMQASIAAFRPRTQHSSFYLAAYFLEKFIIYYQTRVPKRHKAEYLHDFVDTMHTLSVVPPPGTTYKFLRACIKHGVFVRKRYRYFYGAVQYKAKLLPARQAVVTRLRKPQQQ